MDSLTQAVLGASVSCALMGRHTSFAKAAAVGAVAGTLPDLDVLIDHGNDLLNMVRHRAESHALLFLTLASPVFAALTTLLLHRHVPTPVRRRLFEHWLVTWWLVLVTHVGIDAMTSYGTQFMQPFTDHAYAVGSVFIIDPLYTLPMLMGLLVAGWRARRDRPWQRINQLALVLATGYLGWSALAQHHVRAVAQPALAAHGLADAQVFVYATPFNTVLWRVLAITPTHSHEGFYSLLDQGRHIPFTATERGAALFSRWGHVPPVQQLQRFTQGAVRLAVVNGRVHLSDLRMGQEPGYSFVFDLGTPAQLDAGLFEAKRASNPLASGFDFAALLTRLRGTDLRTPVVASPSPAQAPMHAGKPIQQPLPPPLPLPEPAPATSH